MRPIDADELLNSTIYNPLHAPYITKQDVINAPTINGAVDAVQDVRCSECMYCFNEDRETPYDGESWWYCARWDKETNVHGTDPYRFFCADGERRIADGDDD